jgi:dolichyl-phosphate-mannose-protein mannosyltransferase
MMETQVMRYRTQHIVAALLLITQLGFALRMRGLGRIGFNEDEIHKVDAARGYLGGDFRGNLEHPMLMKSLIAISLAATDFWNRGPGRARKVPEEVAVRLPNVIFGSLTAVVLFLVAQEFFGVEVGLLAAFLWSIGTLAIMDNRIAKEDTLLVFFTWLAYYFYARAKKLAETDSRKSEKLYAASGASFGLMLASKYFPHYLGLNFLYYYLVRKTKKYPAMRWRDAVLLFGTTAVVFLLANPVILMPSTLRFMLSYAGGAEVTHHGYLMMGQFRYEDLAHFRDGMPIYFYLLFLAIKTPIPILAAFVVGLVEVLRRRREAGLSFVLFMFLLWIIPFSLLSAKWLRWMLSWLPTVTIIAAIGLWRVLSWLWALTKSRVHRKAATAVTAAFTIAFLAGPLWAAVNAAPFYSLYLNSFGRRPPGYYFPHDEVNDAGLRVAIQQISAEAPRGAIVGGEAKPVFDYYFHRFGRDDLQYVDITAGVKNSNGGDPYLVVQNEREYIENSPIVRELASDARPAWTVEVAGVPAAQVYHFRELAEAEGTQ